MAATATVQSLSARSEIRMVDYDIDGALNIVDLGLPQGAGNSCLPAALFRRFRARLFRSVGAGSVTKFQIIAATSAAGANPTIVVEHAIGSAPDAVNDQIGLECDAEQIKEVLATATHVGVRVQLVTAGDEAVIFFERAEPRFPQTDLTSDYIA